MKLWLCGLVVAALAAGGCKQRGSVSAIKEGEEPVIVPTGDYFDHISRLNNFLKKEVVDHSLAGAIKTANDNAWQALVAAGKAPAQAEPQGAFLESWVKTQVDRDLVMNEDEGSLEWRRDCKIETEKTEEPVFGLDEECTAESKAAAAAIRAKNYGYFKTAKTAKYLLWSGATDKDWTEYWESIYKNSKLDNAYVEYITWKAPHVYELSSGNCTATISIDPSGTYTLNGSGVVCELTWPNENTSSVAAGRVNLQSSLELHGQFTALAVAEGGDYKMRKFGDNAPFYQLSIKDYDFREYATLDVYTNSGGWSQSTGCRLDDALGVGAKKIAEPRCADSVGWKPEEESYVEYSGLTHRIYRMPTIDGRYLNADTTDINGACDYYGGKDREERFYGFVAQPRLLTKTRKPAGTLTASIDRNSAVSFGPARRSVAVIQDLVCYHPYSLHDGQLKSQDVCKYEFTTKGVTISEPRFHYRGKDLPFISRTAESDRGLCRLLGFKKYVSKTTHPNLIKTGAVGVDVRGIAANYVGITTAAIKTITCADARKVGTKSGNPTGLPVDSRGDVPVDSRGDIPLDSRGDVSVDARSDVPVDSRGDVPVDSRGDVPVDSRGDVPVDSRGDVPVTSPAAQLPEPIYFDPQSKPWCPPLPPGVESIEKKRSKW